MTHEVNIIALKSEVVYGVQIGILIFDLGTFRKSMPKGMHTFIANISLMVTDRETLLSTNRNSRLVSIDLGPSQTESQSQTHFINGNRWRPVLLLQ